MPLMLPTSIQHATAILHPLSSRRLGKLLPTSVRHATAILHLLSSILTSLGQATLFQRSQDLELRMAGVRRAVVAAFGR